MSIRIPEYTADCKANGHEPMENIPEGCDTCFREQNRKLGIPESGKPE